MVRELLQSGNDLHRHEGTVELMGSESWSGLAADGDVFWRLQPCGSETFYRNVITP